MADKTHLPEVIRFAHRQMLRCEGWFIFPGFFLMFWPFYYGLWVGRPFLLVDPGLGPRVFCCRNVDPMAF